MTRRSCSGCQLCCRLLPMREFSKPANTRCQHQKFGVGCKIYANRPASCELWTCRWLTNNETADLSRPDRSHYVIDVIPDYVTLQDNDGEPRTIPVIQIWVDPAYPEAHRDPTLRAYLDLQGQNGIAALLRFDSKRAIGLFPPSMSDDGQWHEVGGGTVQREHSFDDKLKALGSITVELEVGTR